jgi:gluconokinase
MVIVIMGVSGSGKTVVGESLAARLGWAFEDADDWHSPANIEKMRRGVALTDDDRRQWILSLRDAIQKWIVDERDVALACSALRERYRDVLCEGDPNRESLRFVYLKGTYEEIDQRLRSRVGHFMPESLLKSQFAALEEPGPSEALVVDVGQPVSEIVATIIQGVRIHPPSHPM